MPSISESPVFTPDIYQIQTTDPVLGGPDTSPANIQAKQLADRTQWLKERIDAGGFGGDAVTFGGNMNTLTDNGFFYITTGASNKPAATDGLCLVMANDGDGVSTLRHVRQFFIGTAMYYRLVTLAVSPSFGPWIRVQDDAGLIGSVSAFAMSTVPAGWLKCNGASLSRTTYAGLFAKIGTTFGAVDSTHFNVPDLRGRFIRGWADDIENDLPTIYDEDRVFGTDQTDALKTHHHTLVKINSGGGGDPANDGYDLGTFNNNGTSGGPSLVNVSDFGDVESRPINLALMYCIKYV